MKRILCSILISAQLMSCAPNVGVPPDRNSGDTTQMDFEADEDGNISVSDRDSGDRNVGETGGTEPPPQNPSPNQSGSGNKPGGSVKVDVPGFFEGIGDLAGKLGGLIADGIGEISGANKRKKKEAEKKAKELEGLANEIEKLKGEIGNRAKELESSNNAVAAPDYYGTQDTQDAINNRGNDHNKDVEKTRDSLPDLGKDPQPSPSDAPNPLGERDPYPTPEKEKVRKTREFINASRNNVEENFSGDERKKREGVLDTADDAADTAEDSFRHGDNAAGDQLLGIARSLADAAISSMPVVGGIYDIAVGTAGYNPVTGETLSKGEMVASVAGGLVSIATGGVGGGVSGIGKAADILRNMAKNRAKNEAKRKGKEYLDKRNKEIDETVKDASDDIKTEASTDAGIRSKDKAERNPLPADQKYHYDDKIGKQMEKRGWDDKRIDDTMRNPDHTVATRDTRHNRGTGTRNDDPATAYVDKDGHYVVRNDKTGQIVQVSDRLDPDWISTF